MSLPDEAMKLKDGKIIYDQVASMIAVQYAEAESNPSGSYVIYNGSVYRLPNGHTANASWANTEKEGPTNIGEKLSSLSTAIQGVRKTYNTVADMLADTSLTAGMNVETKGYYAIGDNGHNEYAISSTHDGVFYLTLDNGLYANLMTEKGVLRCESIGMKGYNAETENPNEDDMHNNAILYNRAIDNGIYIIIGKGYFYFDEPINLTKGTFIIQGVERGTSRLIFPYSDGLVFSEPKYYNYFVIKGLFIKSYGHCIKCAENALTVLDSRFEWLYLISQNGDGFHAPNYNIAKYETTDGRTIYDTCVQNCVFDFINVEAHNGAGIANVMGMYSTYKHFNFVSCKYAFRNCDGTLEQANTLSTTPGIYEEYFIYLDKAYSHSLKWKFINVNAEWIGKAFIYTEPQVNLPQGEDVKKPDTANIMTLQKLTAIDSGWSLTGGASNHDVYPITVHRIEQIEMINSNEIISPSAYPSHYDTSIVKGQIKLTEGSIPSNYKGTKSITVVGANNISYKVYGNEQLSILTASKGHEETGTDVPTSFNILAAKKLYGGKATQVWNIKASDYSSNIINPPKDEFQFADIVKINNDTQNRKNILILFNQMGLETPGRIITIINDSNSINDIRLLSPVQGSTGKGSFAIPDYIDLKPNMCIHLITTVYTYNNSTYIAWKPIELSRSEPSEINVTGSTPTINGIDGTTYFCGEVTSINIVPPDEGIIEVYFKSGATAATLEIPRSVSISTGFDLTNLDTNTIYKIRIRNNTYGEIETLSEQPFVNLIDISTLSDDYVWYGGTKYGGYDNWCATPKIEVTPGTKYILKRDGGVQGTACWFDENEDYVSSTIWNNGETRIVEDGIHYVAFNIKKTEKNTAVFAVY